MREARPTPRPKGIIGELGVYVYAVSELYARLFFKIVPTFV